MRIKTLFAAFLAAGLLFSGCRQDEDYVLPSLRVGTESLEFGQQTTEQVIEVTATRDWQVRSKPDWVAIDPDNGPAASTPQRVTVTVLDNPEYDRSGDILFSIGLSKAAVSVTQAGAKGAKSTGSGTLEDPYTFEGANAAAAALGADVESPTDVYIKGKISRIANNGTFTEGGTFGNASFYVNDEGVAGEHDFYCYRVLYLGNKKYTSGTDIKVGDEVIVCGKIVNYKGNTPETVASKAFLYSLNGVTEGGGGGGGQTGTPKGTGTLADPYNAAGANAAAAALGADVESATDVYIKGKICKIANNGTFVGGGEFGNASFYVSDDGATGGAEFYCFRILYLGNQKYTSGTDIKVGDEVVVCGKIVNYKGNTPETVANKAYLYSLNGVTEGGGGGGGGQSGTVIFSQAFKTAGQGEFSIDNKKALPEGLTYVWSYDNRYGMKASGYANNTNFDTESWLISPEIDLASAQKPALSFKHALNFFENLEKAKEEASVWVKAAGGDWTKLSGVAYPESMSWSFVESGKVDLSAYKGKKIQIAFKYISTSNKAGTWEVDEFLISEQ